MGETLPVREVVLYLPRLPRLPSAKIILPTVMHGLTSLTSMPARELIDGAKMVSLVFQTITSVFVSRYRSGTAKITFLKNVFSESLATREITGRMLKRFIITLTPRRHTHI